MYCRLLCTIVLAALACGCSLCASPHDYCYPAYGGTWDQGSQSGERVGSAFSQVMYEGPIMHGEEVIVTEMPEAMSVITSEPNIEMAETTPYVTEPAGEADMPYDGLMSPDQMPRPPIDLEPQNIFPQ